MSSLRPLKSFPTGIGNNGSTDNNNNNNNNDHTYSTAPRTPGSLSSIVDFVASKAGISLVEFIQHLKFLIKVLNRKIGIIYNNNNNDWHGKQGDKNNSNNNNSRHFKNTSYSSKSRL